MAEKEKNEVEVVEVKDETKEEVKEETKEEAKEEKKDNAFSKWWKKTKENVKDSILESNIESTYNKKYGEFTVYSYGGGLLDSFSVHGEIVDNKLTYFGEKAIAEFNVVIDDNTKKAYYAKQSTKTEVQIMYDGVDYTRPGTQIELDENVEEVNVVKAGSRYFIYKGKINKEGK